MQASRLFLSSILFCCVALSATAQEHKSSAFFKEGDNYYTICRKADSLFALDDPSTMTRNRIRFSDDERQAYERWKWYWRTRIDENGNFPDLVQNALYTDSLKRSQRLSFSNSWVNISQTVCDGGYDGMGRATCIAFDPLDANTMYVGAPIGGLWKTTDGGLSYAPLTDNLPYVSVGSCVVDYTNGNTIYISVGDHMGWWNYSLGVYKSIDGGATWSATGLNWQFSQGRAIANIAMDPFNNLILYAATTNGLYRTLDGGTTWTSVRNGDYSQVLFEPGSSNVYAALNDYWGSSEVFRSTDGGTTWVQQTNFNLANNFLRLAVTPANPTKLAILCQSGNLPLYESTNYGANPVYVSDCPEGDILYYSANNDNVLYCGAVHVYKSTDAGVTWTMQTFWYDNPPFATVHADQRNIAHHPLVPDEIFFCNDGGLYRYTETADQWTELTDGLVITQFYKIANSQTDSTLIIGGTQDNGGRIRTTNNLWRSTNGGDAMEVAIDPTNNNTIYTTYVNGELYRSFDQWTNDTYYCISNNIPGGTPPGSWVTPYMLSPADPNTLIAGYDDVWMTTDQGANWTALSTNLTNNGATLNCLAIAPNDPNTIWVSEANHIYITNNLGTSWIQRNVPGSAEITSITIHPTNPQKVWITRGGYSSSIKVYMTTNGGTTWINWSAGLPNTPVNTSLFEIGSPAGTIYIGMDAGVYYRDSLSTTWQLLGSGLPNTAVTDLEIYYPSRKMRAGTYGRGIWEISLPQLTSIAPINSNAIASLVIYPNPAISETEVTVFGADLHNANADVIVYNTVGQVVYTTITIASAERLRFTLPKLPAGNYMVLIRQDEKSWSRRLLIAK